MRRGGDNGVPLARKWGLNVLSLACCSHRGTSVDTPFPSAGAQPPRHGSLGSFLSSASVSAPSVLTPRVPSWAVLRAAPRVLGTCVLSRSQARHSRAECCD